MKGNTRFKTFHIWQAKHISTRNLIIVLSIVIGICAGVAASLLKWGVYAAHMFVEYCRDDIGIGFFYVLFPLVGLFLTVFFIKYLNRNRLGRGIPYILYSISRKAGHILPDRIYSHILTSAFTVGFGGSAGLEAPIVSTGAALGSNFARTFHLNYKKRLLLIGCGAAAATSAIFNAPIAGVIFTLEILLLELSVPSFLPLLIASVAGTLVGSYLGGAEKLITYNLDYVLSFKQIPLFMLLGVACGFLSIYFTRTNQFIEKLFLKLKSKRNKALIGGLLVGVLVLIFPPLFGEGYDTIRHVLSGDTQSIFAEKGIFGGYGAAYIILFCFGLIVFKALATTFTLSGGGNGGIFAPSLFIGSLAGFLFAKLIGIEDPTLITTFALVGMAGLMTGVMHAPLTAIFLIAEITSGYALFLPLMIVSVVSYFIVHTFEPHSMYTKQLALKGLLFSHNKDKEVLTRLNLKRVIEKDLTTVNPNSTLRELVKAVQTSSRNIFPVVDDSNELKGIILLDDIRQIMFNQEAYDSTMISDLMHAPPAYISIHEDMASVMQKFKETGAWNLPVLEGNKYAGFLSKAKIFNIYRTMLIRQGKEE